MSTLVHGARVATLILALPCAIGVFAQDILYQPQPDSPIGSRNPSAPAGTAQYEFLIGDWEVSVRLNRAGQEPLAYAARWHNHWIADGYAVMQEWRGPYSTGIEIRSYDAADDSWHGRNIYFPAPANWYENTARLIDDEMIVTTHRTDGNGNDTITREIYFDISESAFSIRTELSQDGGVTWKPGRYSAVSHRLGAVTP